jgi:hypothetical protein
MTHQAIDWLNETAIARWSRERDLYGLAAGAFSTWLVEGLGAFVQQPKSTFGFRENCFAALANGCFRGLPEPMPRPIMPLHVGHRKASIGRIMRRKRYCNLLLQEHFRLGLTNFLLRQLTTGELT